MSCELFFYDVNASLNHVRLMLVLAGLPILFFFHVKYGYTRRVDYDPHVKSTKRFLSTNITIWINSFGQSNFEEQLSAKYGMFEFQKKIN